MTAKKAERRTPEGLSQKTGAWWRKVTADYVFRADELVVLEKACRAMDRVVAMEAELGGAVTATGSMGQVVVHPLIPEIRTHEAQIKTLLQSLKLPDTEAGAAEEPRSSRARAAAQSRWSVAHGRSA